MEQMIHSSLGKIWAFLSMIVDEERMQICTIGCKTIGGKRELLRTGLLYTALSGE